MGQQDVNLLSHDGVDNTRRHPHVVFARSGVCSLSHTLSIDNDSIASSRRHRFPPPTPHECVSRADTIYSNNNAGVLKYRDARVTVWRTRSPLLIYNRTAWKTRQTRRRHRRSQQTGVETLCARARARVGAPRRLDSILSRPRWICRWVLAGRTVSRALARKHAECAAGPVEYSRVVSRDAHYYCRAYRFVVTRSLRSFAYPPRCAIVCEQVAVVSPSTSCRSSSSPREISRISRSRARGPRRGGE